MDDQPTRAGLAGTANQIEWAARIRLSVAQEFDRVARVLGEAARAQSEEDRLETFAMISILEEQRTEALANDRAGYFIRNWQELDGRVRTMLAGDSRFQAIVANRRARKMASDLPAPAPK